MTSKNPPQLPHVNLILPQHYKKVDAAHAIKGIFGECGLPKPETCGIDSDAVKLAEYTELFQKAERLYVRAPFTEPNHFLKTQTPEAEDAIRKGWEYLEAYSGRCRAS